MKKRTKLSSTNPKALRAAMRVNQGIFWSRVGITQSGGSRYESGRRIPRPVTYLLALAYGNSPLAALAELRNTTVDELIKAGR